MNDQHDLTVILRSRFPIVVIETHEEMRVIALLERITNLEEQALFVRTAPCASGRRTARCQPMAN